MDEIFKDIEGYEGLYQVTNMGRVWSVKKKIFLNPEIVHNGYYRVRLYKGEKQKQRFRINRLVALTFIPNPENKPQVNHINEDKKDNRVENLEWVTAQENINHGTRNKRITKAKSKQIIQKDIQGNVIRMWKSIMDVQRTLGINNSQISNVCNGKGKTAGGFLWEFYISEVDSNV